MGGRPAFVPKGRMRKTRPEDIDAVMALYDIGRQTMRNTGNTEQWTGGYPHRHMIEEDVRLGRSYVYEEDGVLQAVFALIWGEDPTYRSIDGAWLSDTVPYGTIHRIASRGEVPGLGSCCINWCLELCGSTRRDDEGADALAGRSQHEIADFGWRAVGRGNLDLCLDAELLQKLHGRLQNRPIRIASHEDCYFHGIIFLPVSVHKNFHKSQFHDTDKCEGCQQKRDSCPCNLRIAYTCTVSMPRRAASFFFSA